MPGRTDAELVRELEKKLSAHSVAPPVDAKCFKQLAQAVLKRADEDFLLVEDGTRWLRRTEGLAAFAHRRLEGDLLVEISAPEENEGDRFSLLRTCMSDQPFIVDTIRLALEQSDIDLRAQHNVVVPVDRAEDGIMRHVGRESDRTELESIAEFEITPVETAKQRKELTGEITERLIRARAMSGDFRRMLRRLKDLVNQLEFLASIKPGRREEINESRQFLEWLGEDHFVFLGMTRVEADGKPDERMGLSRLQKDPFEFSYPDSRKFATRPRAGEIVRIQKTSEESRIHRRGKIDEILVRLFTDRGEPDGCVVIHGLFTYRAIQTRGSIVPLLREKLLEVIRLEDVTPGSFNYKSLVNAYNSLPVEYLFGAPVDDLRKLMARTLAAERAHKLEVHVSLGSARRSAFVFVVMPRQSFSDGLREKIQDHLTGVLGANYSDHRVLMSNYGVAVLHFYFTSPEKIGRIDHDTVEERIVAMSATWVDRLRESLLAGLPRDRALALYRRYNAAFSQRYHLSTESEQVVIDLQKLECVRTGEGLQMAFYRDDEDLEQDTMKLRLYSENDLMLSDILPILDNFGLRVVNSFANHARLADGEILTLETYRFRVDYQGLIDSEERRQVFLHALDGVLRGEMANDALNRVLLPAGLTGGQVVLLRSYAGYSKQLGNMTTPGTLWPVLVKHAGIVRKIVALFETKFGPSRNGRIPAKPPVQRVKQCAALHSEILEAIDRVESFNEDRTLRIFLNLVDATLRTSYYADERPHPSIAHKIDCEQVATMPHRKPWREIFVHHFNLDGVHLRGGRIARGGLRWSDRLDDFRTEILGLMTTQMVKNVVIVPLGAKGGFVVKRLPNDPRERRAAGDAHYEIFVNALLDVTDNVVDDQVVSPAGVVCWDEADPYLVVAADKGTAHLSDTANGISESRGFWLGDAFASGGSNGYDHKKIGITARGSWVATRHLLRELGINPDKDTFTSAGIGDMGGDVFGNGMIEHKTTRLLAAFNHLHVFLDPDPDPAVAYKERRRLFRAKASGWDAYDSEKISKGGGVFDRHAKRIALSVPVRRMLDTDRTEMSGNELIHHILCMEVDLLYNGGIGTYVKATGETHADAADPSNDAVRIDASEMHARVVGEGGNLGLTQAARIEFARAGGRINTDFIDNAGGVNISDHEVNLKILFAPLVRSKRLAFKARNELLREIETLVTSDVLEAQGDQARLLSLDERRSGADLAPFDRVIDELGKHFSLKRSQLDLPSVREMDRRMAEGESLSRPELATVASFVKMKLYEELLEDPKLEMEGLVPALQNYFPEVVRGRFAKAVNEHSLRREIALTRLTNRIVDHTGCTFFHEMHTDCGANSRQTFEVYSLLNRAADLWQFKDRLWALGWKVDVAVLYEAWLIVEHALRLGSRHLLEHWGDDRVSENLRDTAKYSKQLQALIGKTESFLDPASLVRLGERKAYFADAGLSAETATRLARIRYLPRVLVVLDLAEEVDRPPLVLASDYFSLGRASRLFDVIRWIDELRPAAYYDALAYRVLRRELHELLSRLVLHLLPVKGSPEEKLDSLGRGREAFAQLERLGEDQLGPAALLVVVRDMRQALGLM